MQNWTDIFELRPFEHFKLGTLVHSVWLKSSIQLEKVAFLYDFIFGCLESVSKSSCKAIFLMCKLFSSLIQSYSISY